MIQEDRVLLAILAHPDDETFSTGGTLALYAHRGVAVHLLCATRGEAGEADAEFLQGYASIAELRVTELNCAASALGLGSITLLDHRDSGMAGSPHAAHPKALVNTPLDALVGEIAACIRRLHPQVVLTHDPYGGYPHPDHIRLHQAVNRAFYTAGDTALKIPGLPAYAPAKLYYSTISRTLLRWVVRLMPLAGRDPSHFGRNGDIDLRAIAAADVPIHARIDFSPVAQARAEASRCYASQGGRNMNRGVAGLLRGWSARHEVFMRGYPAPQPGQIEDDLFTGVDTGTRDHCPARPLK
jgi:LmbE family N-acetylglucosaminyl deacetylase